MRFFYAFLLPIYFLARNGLFRSDFISYIVTMSSQYYFLIEKAIRYLVENQIRQPQLKEVAAYVNMSEFHFQRVFKAWAGVTPKVFLQYLTISYAKKMLQLGSGISNASFHTGLSSTSRLHNHFIKIEAMTPGQFTGKKKLDIVYCTENSPFGKVFIAQTKIGICSIDFIDDEKDMQRLLEKKYPFASIKKKPVSTSLFQTFFDETVQQNIVLHLNGSPFQLKVWEALLKIPSSSLVSYKTIATAIGKPNASRAVGTAIGKNDVAFLIPCHRVIRRSGEIGDYKWNTQQKKVLIAWEASQKT